MADELNLVKIHQGANYDSEFDYGTDTTTKKRTHHADKGDDSIPRKKEKHAPASVGSKRELEKEYSKDEARTQRFHILSMDAFSRHKRFVNDYLTYYGGKKSQFQRDTTKDKTDYDVIRENHKFLWSEDEDEAYTWEKQLAKKYYDKLFKEYCITDLSHYKKNKIALRWRVEKEVITGKGQFQCGNKSCEETEGLRSWEVNFGYTEHEQKRNALVKLRLCPDCSYKLNYHHKKKEVTQKQKRNSSAKEEQLQRPAHSGMEKNLNRDSMTDSSIQTQPVSTVSQEESSIWSTPVKIQEEKSREEEFEDYFQDMLL